MTKKRIIKPLIEIISIISVLLFLLFICQLIGLISKEFLFNAIYVVPLVLINSISAVLLAEFSFDRSNSIFLIAVVGGMLGRFFILIPLVFLCIKFLNIDEYGFILLFFIFYFSLLIYEVKFFHLRQKSLLRENGRKSD